jgi:hypothetical protein
MRVTGIGDEEMKDVARSFAEEESRSSRLADFD